MTADGIQLFSSDLDGTLLGNPDAIRRFAEAWAELDSTTRPLLVYNTGRSVSDTADVVRVRGLPRPDFILGGLGTELDAGGAADRDEFRAQFGAAWDLDRIDEIVATMPGVRRQPRQFTHQFKSSWYWIRARPDDLATLKQRLVEAGISATVVYSCRYFLDVIPRCAGKGKALAWLCRRLDIPLHRVVVAGDTGNDTDMFLLPGIRGIVVGNALPELRAATLHSNVYPASAGLADGVIEGLRHFGVIAGSDVPNGVPGLARRL